jgi:hypothetical protein
MPSLFPAFTSAATGNNTVHPESSILWLIFLAISVLDDEKRREKERRRKRQAQLQAQQMARHRPHPAPRPW